MAGIQSFFATIMAVLQLALQVGGIAPLSKDPIDYGGDPYYGAENITEWLTLADNGASEYKIILPAAPKPTESEGARQLQAYFEQISGVALPIETEGAVSAKEIHIGATQAAIAQFGSALDTLKPEGFIKKVAGEKVFMACKDDEATQNRGTLYAVCSFIEEQLGVRWFSPKLTTVPKNALVRIDAKLDSTQNPGIGFRDLYWGVVYRDAEWKVHNKVNGPSGTQMKEQFGGYISYAINAHSLQELVPDSLFASQPELFSYRTEIGGRNTQQRCLTNPNVLQITIENARKYMAGDPNATLLSVTQLDNQEYCQCENCKAEAERLGGQSGLMVWFVNQVARAMKDDFPNVTFDTFAYQYTRHAPTVLVTGENGNVADPNVCIRLCSIECCFAHPLEECGHERGESLSDYVKDIPSSFAQDMQNWQKFTSQIYIWNYSVNFLNSMLPFPNFQVLSPNTQYFADNKVMGVFDEGTFSSDSTEFYDMRAYVQGKLLWDPNADVEYHMMDFMKAWYGEESAGYIKEYIDKITRKTVETSHLFCFNWHYQNTFLRIWDTLPMDCLWDKAEKAAPSDWQLDNIKRSRLQLRVYKADMMVGEFFPLNPFRISENKKLYNDVVDLGLKRWGEFDPILTPLSGIDWLFGPVEWADIDTMFWNKGKTYEPLK